MSKKEDEADPDQTTATEKSNNFQEGAVKYKNTVCKEIILISVIFVSICAVTLYFLMATNPYK